MANLISVYWQ
ncbi:hypothetical protein F383_00504 [Gossypium arboreum]|uniref:Uncharacterized protein n=1 Tax=Gossypium arboreum TaxID=29729 RepID=A0A0B0NTL8_GOSAR|nr:hypothetical protein F383_00504 [Gossypium arboreum]